MGCQLVADNVVTNFGTAGLGLLVLCVGFTPIRPVEDGPDL